MNSPFVSCAHHIRNDQESRDMVQNVESMASAKLSKHSNPEAGQSSPQELGSVSAHPEVTHPASPFNGSAKAKGAFSVVPFANRMGAHEHRKPSPHEKPSPQSGSIYARCPNISKPLVPKSLLSTTHLRWNSPSRPKRFVPTAKSEQH